MKKYYPKGYRKKRQRENVQRATGFFVITVLVIGVAITLGWAAIKLFTPGDPDRGTDEMVAKSDLLREQKNEAEANLNPPATTPPVVADSIPLPEAGDTDGPAPLKLADIKNFEQSFPEIGVQLLQSNEPAELTDEGTPTFVPEGERLTPSEAETQVPSDDEQTETRPAPPVMPDSVRPGPPVSREPDDTPPPAPPRQRETPPADTSDSGSSGGTDNSGDSAGSGSAGVSGKYIYSVYAGIWEDKNAASKKLDDLSGVGYAAKIIERDEAGKKRFFLLVQDKIGDYDKAKEIQSDLKGKGFGDAFVTKRDN